MSVTKFCFPKCRFFRCGKRAVTFRGGTAWCTWADERCNVANCTYALCIKRRLLNNGICGEAIKRRTVERKPEEEFTPMIRVRGKTIKKLRDKEIF